MEADLIARLIVRKVQGFGRQNDWRFIGRCINDDINEICMNEAFAIRS